jgi:hypothetical protein
MKIDQYQWKACAFQRTNWRGKLAKNSVHRPLLLARLLQVFITGMSEGYILMRTTMMEKNMISARKARKARSGKTRVVVIEEAGELTAIVMDKTRGIVRIPLGTVDPSVSVYF